MNSYVARVSTEGDLVLTIPEEARSALGLDGVKAIAVYVDSHGLTRFIPMLKTIEDVAGSVSARGELSLDLDEEIEAAMGEALREKYG